MVSTSSSSPEFTVVQFAGGTIHDRIFINRFAPHSPVVQFAGGLYAEQISGTSFTAPRKLNQRRVFR
ncbi:hypothetical protein QVD17_27724 [Tagetes erecta]|nr:hypothetical protein QVD17_27724 [Tagetes erecta]